MMKKRIVLVALLLLCGATAGLMAQTTPKFAHIDSQALITSMPKHDSVMKQLKAFEQDLYDQMEQLQVEYNKKLQDYSQKRETLTPAMREAKERELGDLGQRANEFREAAQRDFQTQQGKLLQPLIDEVNAAIQKVGKDNGYTYIFDKGAGFLLYVAPDAENILEKVQKELKIK
ncbi:MAG: OmpH family outer membrane protein [Bacteroides sp.]|jgi:Outer membrane protein